MCDPTTASPKLNIYMSFILLSQLLYGKDPRSLPYTYSNNNNYRL